MEVSRDRLHLKENERLISPPIVTEPLYQCATAVNVRGFIAHAKLDVEVAGTVVVSGAQAGFPEPDGVLVNLPSPFVAGQAVRARQKIGGIVSAWSQPVIVRNHLTDFPAGPPRPEIDPAPVYECGSRTGVNNLLIGCNVWITADGVDVGRVDGAKQHQGVNVTPDYGLSQHVIAQAELCHDPSPPSVVQNTQPPLSPLPTPGFEPVYEGGQQVTITNLANGARFTLSRNGVNQGTWSTWGNRHLVGLNPPFTAGEVLTVTQKLCLGSPSSPPGTTTTRPCSALPAPTVAPVQDGDMQITILDFVPDARIKVYANQVKIGDGGGPVVQLTQPIHHGDTIDVLQIVGTCIGQTVQELPAHCVAPPVAYDPSALDLFPVGFSEYNGGTTSILGRTYTVRGSVYYPSQADGNQTAFNERLAQLGPVPIVFIVHGNHTTAVPNYKGYDYFQQQLARMGIIAVSVDENETNGWGWTDNIHHRARLTIASIAYFQSLNAGGDPIFGGRIDFVRVGLMGHSRGAEAVIVVPQVISLPGVTIKGVISLAPVDAGATSGPPQGYAFMTILPAADGDVIDNDGAKFYDTTQPGTFKSQFYVYYANHNFFNRQWTNDDTNGGLPIMTRDAHERILSAYGCAFFRAVLLGHNTTGFLSGKMLPSGVATGNVHLSFESSGHLTVDNHEDGNSIGLNSLGHPTAQLGGLSADEYPFKQAAPGRFNDTFFGKTIGMVAQSKAIAGTFRSQLSVPTNLAGREVWIRVAEVYNGSTIPPGSTGFQLGLEDKHGTVVWVDSDEVGGLPRPYARRTYDLVQWYHTDKTKTMLKTLRFKANCFRLGRPRFGISGVRAILLRLNRGDQRALAFDDLQIV